MQTPGEKKLIEELKKIVEAQPTARFLNIGAGKSLVIENEVYENGRRSFKSDRVDIEDCAVVSPLVGQSYIASVEAMTAIPSVTYDAAFANYVLEHVSDLSAAISEINRVLKPGGLFILSTPNPAAPEFKFSKYTPLRFHQFIKGEGEGMRAYETVYAYSNIKTLREAFEKSGFKMLREYPISFTEGYLYRFPVLKQLSQLYDAFIMVLGIKTLMGNDCLVFQKNTV